MNFNVQTVYTQADVCDGFCPLHLPIQFTVLLISTNAWLCHA